MASRQTEYLSYCTLKLSKRRDRERAREISTRWHGFVAISFCLRILISAKLYEQLKIDRYIRYFMCVCVSVSVMGVYLFIQWSYLVIDLILFCYFVDIFRAATLKPVFIIKCFHWKKNTHFYDMKSDWIGDNALWNALWHFHKFLFALCSVDNQCVTVTHRRQHHALNWSRSCVLRLS